MKTSTLLSFASIFMLCTAANAQMTFTGEIRPRTEYRHGYATLIDTAQNAGIFTSQRTRLNFGYAKEKLKAGIVLQDVRVWGNQSQLNIYDDKTSSLHEAWGEYFLSRHFSWKAGRQEFSYDDERILGGVSWTQQGRSHDAMVVKYADSSFTAHLGGAYDQASEIKIATPYTVVNNYKELYFLWLNKKIKDFSISVLNLNNGYQSPVSVASTRFSSTSGTHLEYKKTPLFASLRYYNQMGVDAGKKEIKAYMAGFDLQWTLDKKIMIGIGGEILSGQSQTDTTQAYTDVVHNFNTLYGTGHKFNGFMDYYYAGSSHGNAGLNDFYIKTKYKREKWWLALDVHQFMANTAVLDADMLVSMGMYEAMDPNLGTEIDLTYAYTFSSAFTLQAGYSHMLATKTTEAIKGGKFDKTQNWAYLMLTFKPNFLQPD